MSLEVPPGVKLTIVALVTAVGLVGALRYARTVPAAKARKLIPTTAAPAPAPPQDVVLPRPDPPPAEPEIASDPAARVAAALLRSQAAAPGAGPAAGIGDK